MVKARNSSSGGSPRPRILVIEDEPAITESLKTGLAYYEGYEAVAALDGKAVPACIRGREIDLIILDTMLPDIDGLEICRGRGPKTNREIIGAGSHFTQHSSPDLSD